MTSKSLPVHQYLFVDRSFIRKNGVGYEPAVWFAVNSQPSRAWGCHVMLECGAIYRGLPAHALHFYQGDDEWTIEQSQLWDCYGSEFQLIEYDYLRELKCRVLVQKEEYSGTYLFTAVPLNDPYTRDPSQSKEFMFIQTDQGRLTIQPTNRVMFVDKSFTVNQGWPCDLKTSDLVWSCE